MKPMLLVLPLAILATACDGPGAGSDADYQKALECYVTLVGVSPDDASDADRINELGIDATNTFARDDLMARGAVLGKTPAEIRTDVGAASKARSQEKRDALLSKDTSVAKKRSDEAKVCVRDLRANLAG